MNKATLTILGAAVLLAGGFLFREEPSAVNAAPAQARGVCGLLDVGECEIVEDFNWASTNIIYNVDTGEIIVPGAGASFNETILQDTRVFVAAWPVTNGMVQWSSNLVDWVSTGVTLRGTNWVYLYDLPDQPQRFYRLKL